MAGQSFRTKRLYNEHLTQVACLQKDTFSFCSNKHHATHVGKSNPSRCRPLCCVTCPKSKPTTPIHQETKWNCHPHQLCVTNLIKPNHHDGDQFAARPIPSWQPATPTHQETEWNRHPPRLRPNNTQPTKKHHGMLIVTNLAYHPIS